jgi:hypothetical protein
MQVKPRAPVTGARFGVTAGDCWPAGDRWDSDGRRTHLFGPKGLVTTVRCLAPPGLLYRVSLHATGKSMVSSTGSPSTVSGSMPPSSNAWTEAASNALDPLDETTATTVTLPSAATFNRTTHLFVFAARNRALQLRYLVRLYVGRAVLSKRNGLVVLD